MHVTLNVRTGMVEKNLFRNTRAIDSSMRVVAILHLIVRFFISALFSAIGENASWVPKCCIWLTVELVSDITSLICLLFEIEQFDSVISDIQYRRRKMFWDNYGIRQFFFCVSY